jgi:hypothetical protein
MRWLLGVGILLMPLVAACTENERQQGHGETAGAGADFGANSTADTAHRKRTKR